MDGYLVFGCGVFTTKGSMDLRLFRLELSASVFEGLFVAHHKVNLVPKSWGRIWIAYDVSI